MSTKQAVSSLYRRSLKLALDWSVHRYLWRGQALYIRTLFDANKNIRDPRQQRASSIPRNGRFAGEVEAPGSISCAHSTWRLVTYPSLEEALFFGDSADIAGYQDLNLSVIYQHQIWTGQGLV
ncbi:hypothetical protein LARI1_G007760 [Lachnellula arida]|uniref:NADH dehydrogenase [ubiquinone] 1 beta subcomplex subunit 9 n=2 Tax=Lachnellula TaxID=47830 RepID=A0A8T9AYE3_9HELO|nr:hypothetical protein LARI1_G007760 [Lachnellula arida]TVY87648.1 hypothetical protein LAWI1_G002962 [Lachnellula willkommii]